MNTIPLIFNERQINRTILGGRESPPDVKLPLGVLLLNGKGSQFRSAVLERLLKMGFEQIVSLEKNHENYNINELSRKFPSVKFVIPLEKVTEGELINIGMSEISCDSVLVFRDNLRVESDFISPRILEKITETEVLCIAPRLTCGSVTNFPVVFSPTVNGSVFDVFASSSIFDGLKTLYSLDNLGIYNRKKFMQLGGFDYTIASAHWQTLDFFMRGWLWGEKTLISTLYSFSYESEFPVEDLTVDLSYSRFFLKNLLPRFDEDHGVIPKSSLFLYLLRSGCGLIESCRQFFDAQNWVAKNKYRFKFDAKYLVENWGKIK